MITTQLHQKFSGAPTLDGSGSHRDALPAFHGVDLAEAMRLLNLDERQISRADEVSVLQQVIDGLCMLSSRDGLTGLVNRRAFNAALEREIDRSVRTGETFGLLLVDIDHFKRINDLHGHLVGDLVLKAVARMIEETFRSIDTVARFGGEEFTVILPNVSDGFLLQIAQRARARIEETRIEVPCGLQLGVTVSIGTVRSRGYAPLDPKVLIEAADRKLYEAKRSGRNRVCCEHAPDAEVNRDERAQLLEIFDSPDTTS